MNRSYKDVGVVLGRKNYSEADRILVLFTKQHGKISVIAKGVRKPKSRKRGSLEIFSQVKFQAVVGRGLDILTEVDIVDSFSQIREDLQKVSVAYFFCEVVGKITREEEKSQQVYAILIEYLGKLETASGLRNLRTDFTKDVLVATGFWPAEKLMDDPDQILEYVTEKKINSVRVGKKLVS